MNNRNYAGIDCFRVIAALLVVAIHTSPLASFSEIGDFILTRIIARVAVPFFFMTSGFFTISRYSCSAKKAAAFIKKTTIIYVASILLYLPLNIYNGYFKMENLLPNMIKDIVFDGTLYHLWYLPAAITGVLIAGFLVKRLDYPKALAVTAGLYFIGLFGDSYYGISEKLSCLRGFYNYIFQVTDYTRNGIFFAPVFFVLGGWIADRRPQLMPEKNIRGLTVSLALMAGEAAFLKHFDLQRHDSMYLFLLPCMYFLFQAVIRLKGKRFAALRTVSLLIYIIHPMMIVAIRLAAKVLHLQKLLVDNSLVHYLAVCLVSAAFSIVLLPVCNRYASRKARCMTNTDRAYLEIDLENLEHNLRVLKSAMPETCELMAVVKAQAYGHGLSEIALNLSRMGVRAFAVATIDEGIMMRKCSIRGEILILGYTAPERARELQKYNLTQSLIDYEYAVSLNRQGYRLKAHIKTDTGMHRLGFDAEDAESIATAFSMKNIIVTGIYTHLCVADSVKESDSLYTSMQIELFRSLLEKLKKRGIKIPKVHIQSSYGLLNYPELKCDYVRAGIALYGILSLPDDRTRLEPDLRPVLSLKAKVVLLRKIKKGESVGYGRSFVAGRDSLIAVLPVGYADGYPRNLSGKKAYVLINGQRAPVVGKICMDQLTVDVTDISDVRTGMTATLIGKDGKEEISAPMLAEEAESISNELLSRMGPRLAGVRLYK